VPKPAKRVVRVGLDDQHLAGVLGIAIVDGCPGRLLVLAEELLDLVRMLVVDGSNLGAKLVTALLLIRLEPTVVLDPAEKAPLPRNEVAQGVLSLMIRGMLSFLAPRATRLNALLTLLESSPQQKSIAKSTVVAECCFSAY
jgi:hypothetical protein